MIPNLLPHPRHDRAIELMRSIERQNIKRVPGQSLAARGHWKYPTEDMKRFLLILCNKTRDLSESDFERSVFSLLRDFSEFPPRDVPPPEVPAIYDRRADAFDHPWQTISGDGDFC